MEGVQQKMLTSTEIITFYSHKGGVGRSQALVNVGVALANRGRKVLLVDMDLEAPGLHRFFYDPRANKRLQDADLDSGVLEWFLSVSKLPQKEPPFPVPMVLAHPGLGTAGSVKLLPAGRLADDYAERLAQLSWSRLYKEQRGFDLVELFRKHILASGADIVLIDARTGLTDVSNVATFQLPDRVVLVFTLHHQGIDGTARMARALATSREEGWNHGRLKQVYLLAARVHQIESGDLRRDWEARATTALSHLGTLWIGPEASIPHDGDAAFGENVVVSPLGSLGSSSTLAQAYERLTDRLSGTSTPIPYDREKELEQARSFSKQLEETINSVCKVVDQNRTASLVDLASVVRRASPSLLGGLLQLIKKLTEEDDVDIPHPQTLGDWESVARLAQQRTDRAWATWFEQPPEEFLKKGRLDRQLLERKIPNIHRRHAWIDQQLEAELDGDLREDYLAKLLELRGFEAIGPVSATTWQAYDILITADWDVGQRMQLVIPLWIGEWRQRLQDGLPSQSLPDPWRELLTKPSLFDSVVEGIPETDIGRALDDTIIADSLLADPSSRVFLARTFVRCMPPPPYDNAPLLFERLARIVASGPQSIDQEVFTKLLELCVKVDQSRPALTLWAALRTLGYNGPILPPDSLQPVWSKAILEATTISWLWHPDVLRLAWGTNTGRSALLKGLLDPNLNGFIQALDSAGLPPPDTSIAHVWNSFRQRAGDQGLLRARQLDEWLKEWTGRPQSEGYRPRVISFHATWVPASFYSNEFQCYFEEQAHRTLMWKGEVEQEVKRLQKLDVTDWLRNAEQKRDAQRFGSNTPYPEVVNKIRNEFDEHIKTLVNLARLREDNMVSHWELQESFIPLQNTIAVFQNTVDHNYNSTETKDWHVSMLPDITDCDADIVRADSLEQFVNDLLSMWAGKRGVSEAFDEHLRYGRFSPAARLVRGDRERARRLMIAWEEQLRPLENQAAALQVRMGSLGRHATEFVRQSARNAIDTLHEYIDAAKLKDNENVESLSEYGSKWLKGIQEAIENAELELSEAEANDRQRAAAEQKELLIIKRAADEAMDAALFQLDARQLEQAEYVRSRLMERLRGLDIDGAREEVARLKRVIAGKETVTIEPIFRAQPVRATSQPVRQLSQPPALGTLAQAALHAALAESPPKVPSFPVWGVWERKELERFYDALASKAIEHPGKERLDWLVAAGRLALWDEDTERTSVYWREAVALGLSIGAPNEHLDNLLHSLIVVAILPALPEREREHASRRQNLERLCQFHQRSRVAERVDQLDLWGVVADALLYADEAVVIRAYERWLEPVLQDYPAGQEVIARRAAQSLSVVEPSGRALLLCLFPKIRDRVATKADRFSARLESLRTALRSLDEEPAAEIAADVLPPSGTSPGHTTAPVSVALLTPELPCIKEARMILQVTASERDKPVRGIQIDISFQENKKVLSGIFKRPAMLLQPGPDGRAEVSVYLREPPKQSTEGTLSVQFSQRLPGGQAVPLETNVSNFSMKFLWAYTTPPGRNPYAAGRPLKESVLPGRDNEQKQVYERLFSSQSTNVVMLVGERRMGKTSLLHSITSSTAVLSYFMHVVWIDLQGIADTESSVVFWKHRVLEPIRKGLEDGGIESPLLEEEAFREAPGRTAVSFILTVDRLLGADQHRPVLVVIDELERLLTIVERNVGLGEEEVAHLREILQSTRHFSFILAGVTDVLSRHTRTSAHRLYGLAMEVPVGPLPEEAAATLAAKPVKEVYNLTPAARDLLLSETGCHPYLLQFVLHRLYKMAVERQIRMITCTDLEELLRDEVITQPIAFANFLDALSGSNHLPVVQVVAMIQRGSRSVLAREVAAQLDRWGRPHRESEARQVLEEIARRTPTVLQRTANGRFRIPVGLFARYLREQRRSASSLVLIE